MSDNQSHRAQAQRRKRIVKHCDGCNGKIITGQQWSEHKIILGHEDDVSFETELNSTGLGCQQCQNIRVSLCDKNIEYPV
jgi:hypothetical protein